MREIKDSKSDEHDYYVEVLTLLKHGYTTHSSLLIQREQDAIQEVFLQVCQMSGINLISLPIWFTSPMEIEHTNQSTKWRGAEVSVYSPPRGSETEESCLAHVLQLRNLNYPHVAKLIAASHVGARVYLYEFAKSDDAIFSRDGKFSWIAVYECILGLRYLNIRGAAHRSFSQRCIMKTRSEKVVLTGNDLVVVPEIEANELLADSFHILTQLVRSSLCYHGLAESPEETTVLESMADFDCNNPIQIPRLLQQFQTHLFATRSAVTKQSIGDLDQCLCDAFATSDGRTFSSAFSDLEDYFCKNKHGTNSLDLLVYHKLLEIYKRLCNRTCSSLPIDLLMKFKEVITRFYNATVANTSSSCSVLSGLSADETAMGLSFSFEDCIEQLALFPELAEIFVVDGNFLKASTVVSNRATVGQICSDQEKVAIVALYESTRRSKLQLSGWRLPQQAQLPAKSELILEELPEWFIPPNEIERGEYVAEGSFGAVYRGKWFGTDVAVKTLVSTATLEDRQAFKHEADIWFLLSQHPNVVQFYGANHVGSQPFFVCEWAGNGTLPEFIGKGWNRSFVWSHLHTVAIALKFLHDRGITHGDLKGNNILIGSDGCVKLADFGLSAFARVDNRGFEEGKERCLGAYRWKAPEVLRGEPSTFASDVFSFAMCIIEVVSGQVPWGPTIPDSSVKFKVMRGCLPRRPDGLFNEEWKMIRLMCACDPAHRVDTASVVKALRDFSDGELDVGSSSASIEL